MGDICKACGVVHSCVICRLREADGGYHCCGECRSKMQAYYREAEALAQRIGYTAARQILMAQAGYTPSERREGGAG